MSVPKSPASVLVVDDDVGLLRLAARALERQGYSVATAASGGDAMKLLKLKQPELLLLDLKLQDSDARQIISQLTAANRLPNFIIITGQGDERVAVEMMKSGARDYLVKGTEFLEALPTVTARALAQIEQERKLAEAEAMLRLSEERFRVALKNSPIIVFNQDADLRYTWVHHGEIFQPGRDLLGQTDAELFSGEEADRMTQIKLRVLMRGVAIRQEVSGTVAGQRHYYDLTVEPVRNAAGEITGITGAAMEITERKRLEEEVLQISDDEQRRIGQDLHDGICQHLAGIELKSQSLAESLEKKSKPAAAQAEQIAKHVRDVIGQTRSLARGLSGFILEAEGWVSALKEMAENTERMFNVKCNFQADAAVAITDQTAATHLYRIAQEAVTNAIKHGRAKAIEIRLSQADDKILLTVSDNGVGMPSPQPTGSGMGLRTMHYRAGLIGATILVQSQAKGGTRIICFLPHPVAPKEKGAGP
jgi:PAS domain S-box-containing protein